MIHTTDKVIMTSFKLQRATKEVWDTLNPILLDGEPGYEKDTNMMKIGDGVHRWKELEYLASGSHIEPTSKGVTKIIIGDEEYTPNDRGEIVLPMAGVDCCGMVSICPELTTPNAAADAKVVGDRLASIDTVVTEVSEQVQELIESPITDEQIINVLNETVFVAGDAE